MMSIYFFIVCFFLGLIVTYSQLGATGHRSVDVGAMLDKITMAMSNADKYVYWEGEGTGWGNQLRGITSALALSVLTHRRLVVSTQSQFTYSHLFSSPTTLYDIRGEKPDGTVYGVHSRLGRGTYHPDYKSSLEHALISTSTTIFHRCGCSFTMFYLRDLYADRWEKVFGPNHGLLYGEIEVCAQLVCRVR
jgi:hypothetical protein